ncbi:branched-chain amino acid transport system II carrier protein [Mobilicoccus sp.]|uniref:branched-chain amino acid transport system II carrier protein n=1 Tax=Mobilicoccus sp. TaxID=2034349 RepID=UPI002897848A|nr:branched-chain amino acid transport system II carrier protein [Mobilicoccus sp.]
MTTRLRPSQTLLLGSLVFGLFFGAGNLVFPVLMGREAGAASPAAATGFLLTAVGLPILGVVASAMAGADSLQSLLRPVSGRLSLWFTCALYLTIGPLFAIPRTATVSYEVGIRPLVGEGHTPLFLFSVAFFALTALAARRPGRLMDWVGRYLTPVFLVLLSALVIASFVAPMTTTPAAPSGPYASAPLARGLVDGYSTMDALASLAFAVVLVDATRRLGVKGPRRLAVELGKAGLVGGLGMAVVYATLAHVGATSVGAVAVADNGGVVLAGVSLHYFGVAGQYLIAAIVLTACLKTAIGLTVACATTFVELTAGRRGAANATETSDQTGASDATGGADASRTTVAGGLPTAYRWWAWGFVGVSFAIANLGLAAIVAISVPVLMFLYPVAIVVIVLALAWPWVSQRLVLARVVIAFTAAAAFFDLLGALPASLAATPVVTTLTEAASAVLPGYDVGFGWVVPALVGTVVGLALSARGSRTRQAEASSARVAAPA